MSYRPLAVAAAIAALSVMHIASAVAQSVYVAPGGVYIGAGAGPVYVTPAVPTNGAAAYVGPGYGYGYGAAAYVSGYDYGYGAAAYVPGYDYGYGAAAYADRGCDSDTEQSRTKNPATVIMDTDEARMWRPGTATDMDRALT